MKKFIPFMILVAGILSAVSCRQADDLNENNLPENASAKVMKTVVVNSTAKNNDSTVIKQATEENDPVKTPIKMWNWISFNFLKNSVATILFWNIKNMYIKLEKLLILFWMSV